MTWGECVGAAGYPVGCQIGRLTRHETPLRLARPSQATKISKPNRFAYPFRSRPRGVPWAPILNLRPAKTSSYRDTANLGFGVTPRECSCPWGRNVCSIVASSSVASRVQKITLGVPRWRRRGVWLAQRQVHHLGVVLVGGRLGLRLLNDDGVRERLGVPLLGRPDADDGDLLALLLLGRGLGVDARPLGVRRRGGPAAVGGRGWSRQVGRPEGREAGDGARLELPYITFDLAAHAGVHRPDRALRERVKEGPRRRVREPGEGQRAQLREGAEPGLPAAAAPGAVEDEVGARVAGRACRAEQSQPPQRLGLAREFPGPLLGRRHVRGGQGPERRVAVAVGRREHRVQPDDVRHRGPTIAPELRILRPHGVVEALLGDVRLDLIRAEGPRRREVAGRRRPAERERAGPLRRADPLHDGSVAVELRHVEPVDVRHAHPHHDAGLARPGAQGDDLGAFFDRLAVGNITTVPTVPRILRLVRVRERHANIISLDDERHRAGRRARRLRPREGQQLLV